MILPKTTLAKIERGKLDKIVESLMSSKFTGYIKLAFKKLELSSGEILFDSGKIVAAEIIRIRSKSSVYGDSALSELLTLDNCVVEIYPLEAAQLKKSVELNQIAIVKETSLITLKKEVERKTAPPLPTAKPVERPMEIKPLEIKPTEIDREKILEKYGITLPENSEIRKIVEEAVGDSELALEVEEKLKTSETVSLEQEKVLQKYGIRKPAEEEIEFLISNALGIWEEKEKDFDTLKKELIELVTTRAGKHSKKTVSII
ncbi:MAG: DUF2226 domain-containing protein, partial [Archaeoglobaceae archaeon]|nr:DUF2226 domain-containing protein [Archaeoglobaceae archaeon]